MAKLIFNGYETNNYKNAAGQEIKGYTLYLSQPIPDEKGAGYKPAVRWDSANKRTRDLYVSERIYEEAHFDNLCYGDEIELICDYSGRITGFSHAR